MRPLDAFVTCLRKSLTTSGRASAAEFWWFYAISTLIEAVLASASLLAGLAAVVMFAPATIAGSVRRLKDVGYGRPWIIVLIGVVMIGSAGLASNIDDLWAELAAGRYWPGPAALAISIAMAVAAFSLLIQPSTPGANKYGPNPNEVTP